jgi:hypothetical protein
MNYNGNKKCTYKGLVFLNDSSKKSPVTIVAGLDAIQAILIF